MADHSWPHGESWVWELRSADGRFFLKQQRRTEVYLREKHALQRWATALGSRGPELLACADDERALLMSALPGTRAEGVNLSVSEQRELHRQAGELLARLMQARPK